MMKDFTYHTKHYLPLLGLLFAGALGFYLFSYDKPFQMVLSVAVSTGYVIWGIIHHRIHKDLYPEVVFEYIVTAILGLVLIFSVIY